jgi:hypothetical protein
MIVSKLIFYPFRYPPCSPLRQTSPFPTRHRKTKTSRSWVLTRTYDTVGELWKLEISAVSKTSYFLISHLHNFVHYCRFIILEFPLVLLLHHYVNFPQCLPEKRVEVVFDWVIAPILSGDIPAADAVTNDGPLVAELVVQTEHALLIGVAPLLFWLGGIDVCDVAA